MNCVQVVLFEGNIAAGKTTLLSRAQTLTCGAIQAIPERVNPSLLRLFYDNPDKYAFVFQLHMMESRINHNMPLVEKNNQDGHITWIDRSILGDFVFAVANYITGKISSAEMDVYFDLVGAHSFAELAQVIRRMHDGLNTKIVYLHSPFEDCKQRADKRGGAEKDSIGLEYYELIEQIYFNALRVIRTIDPSMVHVMQWNNYSKVDRTVVEIMRHIQFDVIDNQQQITTQLADHCNCVCTLPDNVNEMAANSLSIRWYTQEHRDRVLAAWSGVV